MLNKSCQHTHTSSTVGFLNGVSENLLCDFHQGKRQKSCSENQHFLIFYYLLIYLLVYSSFKALTQPAELVCKHKE